METQATYAAQQEPPLRPPQRPHLYLMDEHPHFFYPTLAERIGLNEAIVIQQIHSWIQVYLKDPDRYREKHHHDGRWWIWDSYPDWHKKLPYLSESTIRRTIAHLRAIGLVVSGNYNTLKIDRTLWYTIDYEAYDQLWTDQVPNLDRPSAQNEQMDVTNLDRPLPDSSSPSSPPSSPPSLQESADADPTPHSFEDWLAAGQATTNKAAVLKRMYDTLFPDRDSPDYGYIGAVAKRVGGAGRLAQLLWEAAAKRPTGDVLAYIQATVKGKRSNGAGTPRQAEDWDDVPEVYGNPEMPPLYQEWQGVLQELRMGLGGQPVDRWLRQSQLLCYTEEGATVELADDGCLDWVCNKWADTIGVVLGVPTSFVVATQQAPAWAVNE